MRQGRSIRAAQRARPARARAGGDPRPVGRAVRPGRRGVVPLLFAVGLGVASDGLAGGGPETTLVVVNAESPLSLRIANEYVRLRQIPETHTVWLRGIPARASIDVATFRERVLGPIQAYLARHGLEAEVDTIAYSADFPYAVDFKADVQAARLPKDPLRGSAGSLTGLTFFARRVAAADPGYLGRNRYFRANLVHRGMPRREATAEEVRVFREAQHALKQKAYAPAAAGYRRLLADYPWAARAWYDLARSLSALGDTDGALQALAGAVEHGWAHALASRNDELLRPLTGEPRFEDLLGQMRAAAGTFEPAHGFRSRYVWGGLGGLPATGPADSLDRYYLSTMLAYTGVRGNALPEVLAYLSAAAASDGSAPDGTVYLMENPNLRSFTRERHFEATVNALQARGRRVETLRQGEAGQDGVLPIGKADVVGAVIGAASFDWARSGSRLLPGAIAESLTSYGAEFDNPRQTKLTELLRHGAAGASGAVQEPFAIQAKFPVAYLHVHYADGCSLAEAFYQSVETPYQLLVVGDPLARPYARLAAVTLEAPALERPWSGVVAVTPGVESQAGAPLRAVELWVDGRRVASARPGAPIPWDTRAVEDGVHELRLVAVEATPIETRSHARRQVRVSNRGREVSVSGPGRTRLGEPLALSGRAEGAERVQVLQGTRELASAPLTGGHWRVQVPSQPLGTGPVTLFARAGWPDGTLARSQPLEVQVDGPAPLAPAAPSGAAGTGLRLRVRYADGREVVHAITREGDREPRRLLAKERRPVQARLEGTVEVRAAGLYQLVVGGQGPLQVEVDGVPVAAARLERGEDAFVALGLQAGRHGLVVQWSSPSPAVPRVLLAGTDPPRLLLD